MEMNKTMFSIAYLFLHCDGNLSPSEEQKFDEFIASARYVSDDAKNEVVATTKAALNKAFDESDIPKIVHEEIQRVIDDRGRYFSYEEKISCLWLLVNMAYADGECSATEEDLLRFVFRKFALADKSILLDFEDTARTLLALEEMRESAQKLNYEKATPIIKELDKTQGVLTTSIGDFVNEGED